MINSKTSLFGIIGNPVKHSLSPIMHNAAFQQIGINAVYLAFKVENIQNTIIAIKELNIKGLSITIPHKEEIIKCLDEIDPYARKMNAVNTIINKNGFLKGYNTDGLGAFNSIIENKIKIDNENISIIGNGGTAKAIAFSLLNYAKPNKLIIIGRNKNKIKNFTQNTNAHFPEANINSHLSIENAKKDIQNSSLIINTTPIGMEGYKQISPIPKEYITKQNAVFDVVYKPLKTKLIQYAENNKAKTINGLEMLLNQGIIQFELWTGEKAPKEIMRKAISIR